MQGPSFPLGSWGGPPAAGTGGLTFSAGFTDDAILQRAPHAAAIYGFAPTEQAKVTVTVSDDTGASQAYTVQATVRPHQASGGTGIGHPDRDTLEHGPTP